MIMFNMLIEMFEKPVAQAQILLSGIELFDFGQRIGRNKNSVARFYFVPQPSRRKQGRAAVTIAIAHVNVAKDAARAGSNFTEGGRKSYALDASPRHLLPRWKETSERNEMFAARTVIRDHREIRADWNENGRSIDIHPELELQCIGEGSCDSGRQFIIEDFIRQRPFLDTLVISTRGGAGTE